MKTKVSGLLLAGLVFVSSQWACYGKFALVRKVYEFNGKITDNKFVHSLTTWIFLIIPVYSFAGIADFVVLNVIEFWSGENPVGASTTVGEDGTSVTISQSLKNGADTLEITRAVGDMVLNRIEVTRVDGDWVQAVAYKADGSVEATHVFPMTEIAAGRRATAAQ